MTLNELKAAGATVTASMISGFLEHFIDFCFLMMQNDETKWKMCVSAILFCLYFIHCVPLRTVSVIVKDRNVLHTHAYTLQQYKLVWRKFTGY